MRLGMKPISQCDQWPVVKWAQMPVLFDRTSVSSSDNLANTWGILANPCNNLATNQWINYNRSSTSAWLAKHVHRDRLTEWLRRQDKWLDLQLEESSLSKKLRSSFLYENLIFSSFLWCTNEHKNASDSEFTYMRRLLNQKTSPSSTNRCLSWGP